MKTKPVSVMKYTLTNFDNYRGRGLEKAGRPAAWTPCWFCFLSASSPGGPYTGTSCSTPRTVCGGAWWRSEGGGLDWREKRLVCHRIMTQKMTSYVHFKRENSNTEIEPLGLQIEILCITCPSLCLHWRSGATEPLPSLVHIPQSCPTPGNNNIY